MLCVDRNKELAYDTLVQIVLCTCISLLINKIQFREKYLCELYDCVMFRVHFLGYFILLKHFAKSRVSITTSMTQSMNILK